MAYLASYTDQTFADSINQSAEWTSSSNDEKEIALVYGRLFVDKHYTCENDDWDTDDLTTIPDEVQRANALLAELHTQGELFQTSQMPSGAITKKRVKAGPVETETIYRGAYSKSGIKLDQKPEITMLLSPYCVLGSANRNLIRV